MSQTPSTRRPTRYSRAVADRLCAAFATSTLSLQQIIDADPDLPDVTTIYRWFSYRSSFRWAWKTARTMRFEMLPQVRGKNIRGARSGWFICLPLYQRS